MNPVLILTRNNLELTKKCVDSVRAQDIPVSIYILDNGSTDGTVEWGKEQDDVLIRAFSTNTGFSKGMNVGLITIFAMEGVDHCLIPNNDTILPTWYYRKLIETDFPVVSGTQTAKTPEDLLVQPEIVPIRNSPDFSAILIRRDAWEAIGVFDEHMVNYASDMDYHIRGHRKGIAMKHVQMGYIHEGSATLRFATPEERATISLRADADREVLKVKWGLSEAGGEPYAAMFSPETFGVER